MARATRLHGDSPSGMAAALGGRNAPFLSRIAPIPSGGSPDGTGESPVLPTLITYAEFERSQSSVKGLKISKILKPEVDGAFSTSHLNLEVVVRKVARVQ